MKTNSLSIIVYIKGWDTVDLKKSIKQDQVLLYDGECSFCNGAVQWIIARDPEANISFAAQQGEIGQSLILKHHVPADVDSLIFIDGGKAYIYSDAALKLCSYLHGRWPLAQYLAIIPRFLRNAVYKFVAKNRYTWFGKQQACMIPTPEIRARYMD